MGHVLMWLWEGHELQPCDRRLECFSWKMNTERPPHVVCAACPQRNMALFKRGYGKAVSRNWLWNPSRFSDKFHTVARCAHWHSLYWIKAIMNIDCKLTGIIHEVLCRKLPRRLLGLEVQAEVVKWKWAHSKNHTLDLGFLHWWKEKWNQQGDQPSWPLINKRKDKT